MEGKWQVEILPSIVSELEQDLDLGPIVVINEKELRFLNEERVGNINGLHVYIYADEHPPPHFHVKYGGEENSFSLMDGSPLYVNGELIQYFKNIKKWYKNNRDKLIDAWNRNRPADCTVGAIAV